MSKLLDGEFTLEEIYQFGLRVTPEAERRAHVRALQRELKYCRDNADAPGLYALTRHGDTLMAWLTLDAVLRDLP